MNPTSNLPRPSTGGMDWEVIFPLVLALGVGAAAITAQSFWMDESSTGIIAVQPSLGAWWRCLLMDTGSNNQMPFYMFYVWLWEKIFDPTEWMLRASNLLWLALGFLAVPRRQGLFLITLAVSPFLWYYLNEFRPYIMQFSISLMMISAVWRLMELPAADLAQGKIWVGCFCLGAVLLAGSSLLGVIWMGAGTCATIMALGWQRSGQWLRRCWPIFAATIMILLVLGIYYLWSLKHGHRAVYGPTGLSNVVFVLYELVGFSGLGPGRLDIRSGGAAAFRPFLVPLLIYAVVAMGVIFAGVAHVIQKNPRRVWLGVGGALGAATFLLVMIGVVTHFRVLGRHFMPLATCVLLVVMLGLQSLDERGGWRRWLAGLFLALSLASALSLRFCERHAKDDYRSAAIVANKANAGGKIVWWVADGGSALFYGVPIDLAKETLNEPGRVWWVNDPPDAWLTNTAPPDVVLLSKPEIHDAVGHTRAFLEQNHYSRTQTFQAFTVWQKP